MRDRFGEGEEVPLRKVSSNHDLMRAPYHELSIPAPAAEFQLAVDDMWGSSSSFGDATEALLLGFEPHNADKIARLADRHAFGAPGDQHGPDRRDPVEKQAALLHAASVMARLYDDHTYGFPDHGDRTHTRVLERIADGDSFSYAGPQRLQPLREGLLKFGLNRALVLEHGGLQSHLDNLGRAGIGLLLSRNVKGLLGRDARGK